MAATGVEQILSAAVGGLASSGSSSSSSSSQASKCGGHPHRHRVRQRPRSVHDNQENQIPPHLSGPQALMAEYNQKQQQQQQQQQQYRHQKLGEGRGAEKPRPLLGGGGCCGGGRCGPSCSPPIADDEASPFSSSAGSALLLADSSGASTSPYLSSPPDVEAVEGMVAIASLSPVVAPAMGADDVVRRMLMMTPPSNSSAIVIRDGGGDGGANLLSTPGGPRQPAAAAATAAALSGGLVTPQPALAPSSGRLLQSAQQYDTGGRAGGSGGGGSYRDDPDASLARRLSQEEEDSLARRLQEEERMSRSFLRKAGRCSVCGDEAGIASIVDLRCSHRVCRPCLRSGLLRGEDSSTITPTTPGTNGAITAVTAITTTKPGNQAQVGCLQCPVASCGLALAAWEMKSVLSSLEYEQVVERSLERLICSDANFVRCPKCEAPFEVEVGTGTSSRTAMTTSSGGGTAAKNRAAIAGDDKDNPLQVRCPRCPEHVDFCVKCGATPFHAGRTCEEHRAYLAGAKCRYCHKVLSAEEIDELGGPAAIGIDLQSSPSSGCGGSGGGGGCGGGHDEDCCGSSSAATAAAAAAAAASGAIVVSTPPKTPKQQQLQQHQPQQQFQRHAFSLSRWRRRISSSFGGDAVKVRVCSDASCQEKAGLACRRLLPCGHPCGGTKGEDRCCACLVPGCNGRSKDNAKDHNARANKVPTARKAKAKAAAAAQAAAVQEATAAQVVQQQQQQQQQQAQQLLMAAAAGAPSTPCAAGKGCCGGAARDSLPPATPVTPGGPPGGGVSGCGSCCGGGSGGGGAKGDGSGSSSSSSSSSTAIVKRQGPCASGSHRRNGGTQQEGGDFCNICWTEALEDAPCIQLGCGHVFHYSCAVAKLQQGWPGPRISFNYANCPLCDVPMHHNLLLMHTSRAETLKRDIIRRGRKRLAFEGIPVPKGARTQDVIMDKLAYYMCDRCDRPFFGGLVQCEVSEEEEARGYGDEEMGQNLSGHLVVCLLLIS